MALLIAAAGLLTTTVLTIRLKLQSGDELDLTPSAHWPQPILAAPVEPDDGPIMVTVEYRIDAQRITQFLADLALLKQARRRDGAFAWGVFRDAADPARVVEYFWEESWLAHLRHHEHVTESDRQVQLAVQRHHIDSVPPHVTHYVAADAHTVASSITPIEAGSLV